MRNREKFNVAGKSNSVEMEMKSRKEPNQVQLSETFKRI